MRRQGLDCWNGEEEHSGMNVRVYPAQAIISADIMSNDFLTLFYLACISTLL